ncbi:MAG: hypothetical protein K2H34_11200, partial [Lachnospiraceae bacterium]|nr:hypothetical protein [Lachnospiraceae bacterium]
DVDFAYRFANRIIVFVGGEIVADDTPEVVFHNGEVMGRAHLKQPVVMTIWEALLDKGLVSEVRKTPEHQMTDFAGEPQSEEAGKHVKEIYTPVTAEEMIACLR